MTPVGDDELREMLEARGERRAIDLSSVVDDARRDAFVSQRTGRHARPFGAVVAGLGSVVALALIMVIVLVPLSLRSTAPAVPTHLGPPTEAPQSRAPAPTQSEGGVLAPMEPLTAQGLAEWLASVGPAANGRVVLFEGALVSDPTVGCNTTTDIGCAATVVRGAPTPIVIDRLGGWGFIEQSTGTFALRGTNETAYDGGPVMEFLGSVRPPWARSCGKSSDCHGRLDWPVSDLIAVAPPDGPDLYLVAGWMVRTPAHPCPSPANADGCPTSDLLTPERVQPTRADGSFELPIVAISLPSGTYDEFAPDPASDGAGVVPRPGTFLVERAAGRWVVRARVDPIKSASPSTPAPSTTAEDRYPSGIPRIVGGEPVLVGLDAQARWRDATDSKPFLVGGWFDSDFLTVCSGGIGFDDPNPLAARGCPRFNVAGMPGPPMYPNSLTMPEGDGSIVLRVHTRDGEAASCRAENVDACLERVVVEAVVWWSGDDGAAVEPLGPRQAISRATGVFIMEWRPEGADSQTAVTEDIFSVPIACAAPWPTLLFAIHGDPRFGLVAVFADAASRERFEAATPPDTAGDCLASTIERPAGPRWVSHENVLVLTYGDDVFVDRLTAELSGPDPERPALPMTEPELDRSLETLTDYLLARSTGELDHAWGERLGGEDYVGWTADVFRRHAANALVGRIDALDDEPTVARVGPAGAAAVEDAAVTRTRIYRVTYADATDPALATEEFLVIQMPESSFRDWQLIRIKGEPYPGT